MFGIKQFYFKVFNFKPYRYFNQYAKLAQNTITSSTDALLSTHLHTEPTVLYKTNQRKTNMTHTLKLCGSVFIQLILIEVAVYI